MPESDGVLRHAILHHRTPPLNFLTACLCACTLMAAAASAPARAAVRLRTYKSRHYVVHTDLTKVEARGFAGHMDAVFDEYKKRFSHFELRHDEMMDLYLFRKQDAFVAFLASHGIPALHTSGIFFVQPDLAGLATWTQGRSQSQTFAVLQHEGFHQFAHQHVGTGLPIWVNEGLAQYFEDGVFAGGAMKLGIAHGRRIERVRQAMRSSESIPFDELVNMSGPQWQRTVTSGDSRAGLLYAQSWLMVYYLAHGEGGRHRPAFDRYLELVSSNTPGDRAFAKAFNASARAVFGRSWARFAKRLQPDSLNSALINMEFLGAGLRLLYERDPGSMPRTITALRQQLQRLRFRTIWRQHGFELRASAMDESIYQYQKGTGPKARFELLEASGRNLPPRITAQGLCPTPTLVWSRDAEGQLTHAFNFR